MALTELPDTSAGYPRRKAANRWES